MEIHENNSIKNDILSKIKSNANKYILDEINDTSGINAAKAIAKKSLSNKKKVGCVIVDNGVIISTGFNKVPNCIHNKTCEINNNTHWYVLHAEEDAILKLINQNIKLNNPTIYSTLSPCKNCSKLILQSGIKNIIYDEEYRDHEGIELLKAADINIAKFNN